MIVRVVTARVSNDRAGSFTALMRAQLPILRQHPGLIYVKLARRIDGDVEEVMLYEEWKDTASLYGWTGPQLTRARMMPSAEELVSEVDIRHYEALDVDPATFDEA
jgi:quinol monooxygenase YgiN